MMLHHFREPKHCVFLRQSLSDNCKIIDIGYLGEALPETPVNSQLLCHAMSAVGLRHNFFKSKILEKMPISTAEFYCRQETVDRVVDAGKNIMIAMYAKLTYTSLALADTRQARTQAVSELSSPEERSCTEKGRSQTAPSRLQLPRLRSITPSGCIIKYRSGCSIL